MRALASELRNASFGLVRVAVPKGRVGPLLSESLSLLRRGGCDKQFLNAQGHFRETAHALVSCAMAIRENEAVRKTFRVLLRTHFGSDYLRAVARLEAVMAMRVGSVEAPWRGGDGC